MKCVAILVAASLAGPALGQTTRVWGGSTGIWSNGPSWVGGTIPSDPSQSAQLGGLGVYSVNCDIGASIGALYVDNPNATLLLNSNNTFVVSHAPTCRLSGTIQLIGGTANPPYLRFDQNTTLTRTVDGPSLITMGYPGNTLMAAVGTGPGATLTIGAPFTIRGHGRVFGSVVNAGVLSGTSGPLVLDALTYVTSGNGVIDTGSGYVTLSGGSYTNPRLTSSSSTFIELRDNVLLINPDITGHMFIAANSTAQFAGSTITLHNGDYGGYDPSSSVFNSSVTITGTGRFGGSSTHNLTVAGGRTLTLGPNIQLDIPQGTITGNIQPQGRFSSRSAMVAGTVSMSSTTATWLLIDTPPAVNAQSGPRITGTAVWNLDGTLHIVTGSPGITTDIGSEWAIITGSQINGQFSAVFLPPQVISPISKWNVRYEPTRVLITIDCLADVTNLGGRGRPDGAVTIDDLIAYLDAFFTNKYGIADVTGFGGSGGPDNQLTSDDLVKFLQVFFANCT
ncbi:MAG: GC-type dockerin domain-anchored protein [Phycisphaerales bacterium]